MARIFRAAVFSLFLFFQEAGFSFPRRDRVQMMKDSDEIKRLTNLIGRSFLLNGHSSGGEFSIN